MKVFIPHYSNEVEKRVLKEKATMEEPSEPLSPYAMEYEKYISSLQTIPMPDMPESFKDRQDLKEGQDFSFIYQFKHLPSSTEWHNCPESVYEAESKETRRIIAIAIEGMPDLMPTKEKLEAAGMDMKEYLLRLNLDNALKERDELRWQVKALSAVKKGLETALINSAIPDRERGVTISTGDDYGARILERNQFYYKTLLKIKDIQEEEMYLTKSPLEMLTMINQIVDDAIIGASPSTTQSVAQPVSERGVTISDLLNLLAEYGGTIESTGKMDEMNIKQARASNRMWVDNNGLGYVWMPREFSNGPFPETPKEVELFERWFPLPVELPDSLKNMDWMKNGSTASVEQPVGEQGVNELKHKYSNWFFKRDGYWPTPEKQFDWFIANVIAVKYPTAPASGVERSYKIGIDEVHELVRRYNQKEISVSKMTEIINDKINTNGI